MPRKDDRSKASDSWGIVLTKPDGSTETRTSRESEEEEDAAADAGGEEEEGHAEA